MIHGLGTCFVYNWGSWPWVAQGPESSMALLRGPAPPVPSGPLVQGGSVLQRSCLTSPYLFSARLFLPLCLIAIWLPEGYTSCIAPSRSSAARTPPSSELRFQKSPANVSPRGTAFQRCGVESLHGLLGLELTSLSARAADLKQLDSLNQNCQVREGENAKEATSQEMGAPPLPGTRARAGNLPFSPTVTASWGP